MQSLHIGLVGVGSLHHESELDMGQRAGVKLRWHSISQTDQTGILLWIGMPGIADEMRSRPE